MADSNNIREMNLETDLARVAEIWLKEVKRAHLLICDKFWDSKLSYMIKETQDNAKERYVYVKDGIIMGFITARNDGYIFELYVESQFQRRGIGKRLLDELKGKYSNLTLSVYRQNTKAIEFYQKNGFGKHEQPYACPETGCYKLKMKWPSNDNS